MENTCDFENCEFAKKLFDKKEECFNYIESWWVPAKGEKPVLICDCTAKRMFLMIQDLHNRLIGVQQSQEEQRNESNTMKNNMIMVMKTIANITGQHDYIEQVTKDNSRLIDIRKE